MFVKHSKGKIESAGTIAPDPKNPGKVVLSAVRVSTKTEEEEKAKKPVVVGRRKAT